MRRDREVDDQIKRKEEGDWVTDEKNIRIWEVGGQKTCKQHLP